MAAPTWTSGEVLSAADVNSWFVPLAAYKTSSTNRSSTSITIDPDLQLTLDASAVYEIRGGIIYQSTVACRHAWTYPSGAAGGYASSFNLAGTGAGTWGYTFSATNIDAAALGASVNGITVLGFIQTSTTSGTFGFKWGSASGPASLTIGVGSYLVARRIG